MYLTVSSVTENPTVFDGRFSLPETRECLPETDLIRSLRGRKTLPYRYTSYYRIGRVKYTSNRYRHWPAAF